MPSIGISEPSVKPWRSTISRMRGQACSHLSGFITVIVPTWAAL